MDKFSSGWRALGATVPGARHLKEGLVNQDAIAAWPPEQTGPVVLIAVADGHGYQQHFRSRAGADAAVLSAVDHAECFFEEVDRSSSKTVRKRDEDSVMTEKAGFQQTIASWRERVLQDAREHPFENWELRDLSDSECQELTKRPEIAYGTTLLVGAVTENGAAIWQLGDGAILWVEKDGKVSRPLEKQEMPGEATHSLCEAVAANHVQMFAASSSESLPAMILLSTDGYEKSTAAFDSLGPACLEALRTMGQDSFLSTIDRQLEDVSRQGNGDDITVGVAVRCEIIRAEESR